MNERLKFSWGHIIAFLALIIVSYLSFVGFTYLTNGNFIFALIGMGITDILYIIFFIGAQQMKASGKKIHSKIIWERFFIFGTPIIFIAGMIAISHVWVVTSRNETIVTVFNNSIKSGNQLFADYEEYANQRLTDYEMTLQQIVDSKQYDSKTYKNAGFVGNMDDIQKENMLETLQLQLLSENYQNLKSDALEWIKTANAGASTWNVFLLGNTKEIKQALINWENDLKAMSINELTNETIKHPVEGFSSVGVKESITALDELSGYYTQRGFPTITAVVMGVILYLCLIFPYLIQQRHGRQVAMGYSTFGRKKFRNKPNFDISNEEIDEIQDVITEETENGTTKLKKIKKFSKITLE